ncbi:hypothetical protein Cni_G15371 [Canna indica]|uniref:Uncharacterized protein n=1 Tax=Canna indica TaxID=4628 RepID=A0AAQ3KE02_9LILI|nr:hypothetical protein Cni_G15371 [Canna indica]
MLLRRRGCGAIAIDDSRAKPDNLDIRDTPRPGCAHLVVHRSRPLPSRRLPPYADDDDEEEEKELLLFRIRSWLLWKRWGTRRFHLKDRGRHRCVDFAWDLTHARFPPGGGPEPASGFYRCVGSVEIFGGARGLNSMDAESRSRRTFTTGSSSPRTKWPPAPPRAARRLN